MAKPKRTLMFGQRCPILGKMSPKTSFTTKKLVWEAIEKLAPDVSALKIYDDMTHKEVPATYGALCDRLRVTGRATLVGPDGIPEFQIFDREQNVVADWDVDAEGQPRCNPVAK